MSDVNVLRKKQDAKKDGVNSKMLLFTMYLDLKDVIRAYDCGDDAYSESELRNNTLTKINAALDTMRFGLSSIENEIKRISKGDDAQ